MWRRAGRRLLNDLRDVKMSVWEVNALHGSYLCSECGFSVAQTYLWKVDGYAAIPIHQRSTVLECDMIGSHSLLIMYFCALLDCLPLLESLMLDWLCPLFFSQCKITANNSMRWEVAITHILQNHVSCRTFIKLIVWYCQNSKRLKNEALYICAHCADTSLDYPGLNPSTALLRYWASISLWILSCLHWKSIIIKAVSWHWVFNQCWFIRLRHAQDITWWKQRKPYTVKEVLEISSSSTCEWAIWTFCYVWVSCCI